MILLILLFFLFFLLGAVFLLLGFILLLYAIPLDVIVYAEREQEGFTASASLDWGILGCTVQYQGISPVIHIRLFDRNIYSRVWEGYFNHPIPGSKNRMPDIGNTIRALQHAWPGILKILSAVVRSISCTCISCRVRYGAQDAATTGRIFGYCSAVLPAQFLSGRISVDVTPVFDREVLEGYLKASVRLHHPLLVCTPVVQMFLDRNTREAFSTARQGGVAA